MENITGSLPDMPEWEYVIRRFPRGEFEPGVRFIDHADLDFVKRAGDQPDFSDEEIAILEELTDQRAKEKKSRIIQNTAQRTIIITGMEMPQPDPPEDKDQDVTKP